MADKRSACIIQLIRERDTFYETFAKACIRQWKRGTHKHADTPTQTQGLVFASWETTGLPFHFAKSNIQ